ncbi:uncharacterized protein LOC114571568 isoform X2 [Perca flavescens]|uniref:uncharacterized protein LOC114571568 isoform X2 n=1 Tax=Perca flavescens TaxID=8167 RepID=UPI00106E2D4F|nr:uncharacterized protein LOC114571568 isoform X2 [Perca flavescens]
MGYTSRRPHQDHFEEAAYETGRVDGLRRLRSTAVPTQFVFTPRKTPGRTTRRSTRTEEEPCVGGQERVQIDHSYCSKSCPASFEVQTACDSWNLAPVPESYELCCQNSPLCQQNIQRFSNASGILLPSSQTSLDRTSLVQSCGSPPLFTQVQGLTKNTTSHATGRQDIQPATTVHGAHTLPGELPRHPRYDIFSCIY